MGIFSVYIGFNVLVLFLFLATVRYSFVRKKGNRQKPFWQSLAVLSGQFLFMLLFFTETFAQYNGLFFDSMLWIVTLLGIIYTVKELKNNVWIALLLGFVTTVFMAFIPLTVLLSGM